MIIDKTGSIFDSGCEILVCPVNCAGVMGKGLALEFKRKFSYLDEAYRIACNNSTIKPGRGLYLTSKWPSDHVQRIYLIPTKDHWRDPSTIDLVSSGMRDLAMMVSELPPRVTVAIPALGCGLGGLKWDVVRPIIVDAVKDLDADFYLYPPCSP